MNKLKAIIVALALTLLTGCGTIHYSNGETESKMSAFWRGLNSQPNYPTGTVLGRGGLPTGERIYISQ